MWVGGLEGRLVFWSAGGGGGNGTEEMSEVMISVERNSLTTGAANWRLASQVSGCANNRMICRPFNCNGGYEKVRIRPKNSTAATSTESISMSCNVIEGYESPRIWGA